MKMPLPPIDLGTRHGESPFAALTTAKGMPARLGKVMYGFQYIEAFCLMLYSCSFCGHREVLWNSRDGVTAFGTMCPSCGRPEFCHSMLGLDWCVPQHRPHVGQRVWIDMSAERAAAIAARLLSHKFGSSPPAADLAGLTASTYHQGHAPDLVICGYGWTPKP